MKLPIHSIPPPDPPLVPPSIAGKLLLNTRELSAALPMPTRTIEKLASKGIIPRLKITPRMVRYELSAVLAALRQYETATLRK